jgi:hypothetical protein
MIFLILVSSLCGTTEGILADWDLLPGDLFCSAPANTPIPRVGDSTYCALSFADESIDGGCILGYNTNLTRYVVRIESFQRKN